MAKQKNRALRISDYPFSETDKLLFDANIWLYVLSPQPGLMARSDFGYSNAMKRMKHAKSEILLDVSVMGEVINKLCRIYYAADHASAYQGYKDFRKSAAFLAVARNVCTVSTEMLKVAQAVDFPFAHIDREWVVEQVGTAEMDYTDALLVQTCFIHKWKLVTHDGDLCTGGIDVITANRKLIAACQ